MSFYAPIKVTIINNMLLIVFRFIIVFENIMDLTTTFWQK